MNRLVACLLLLGSFSAPSWSDPSVISASSLSAGVSGSGFSGSKQNAASSHLQGIDWLRQMSRAAREANYQGILVFGGRQSWHTLAIDHQFIDGMEYEKISHLTGDPKDIVRVGRQIIWSSSGGDVGKMYKHSSGLLSAGAESRINDVAKHYRVELAGNERIAGRVTQKLELLPADHYRFGQTLWLDLQTGLMLRCDLQNEDGRVVERYQFATLAMHTPEASIAQELQSNGLISRIQDSPILESDGSEGMVIEPLWGPDWLPPGFDQISHSAMPSKGEILTYSDGISAFSLFLDEVKGKRMPDMDQRWGATSAVVRHIKKDNEKLRVTVVGEIPMKTAREVARSVRFTEH